LFLLDNSAWARLASDRLGSDRADVVATWMSDLELATCLPILLEAGYSARSGTGHASMMLDLARLPRVQIDQEVELTAMRAQRELAEIGHHRLAPADVIIAACAHTAAVGVLHYDRDYDVLSEHTSLAFSSEWLAPAGTL
jgi:predicted nucleic acid-binding protein